MLERALMQLEESKVWEISFELQDAVALWKKGTETVESIITRALLLNLLRGVKITAEGKVPLIIDMTTLEVEVA